MKRIVFLAILISSRIIGADMSDPMNYPDGNKISGNHPCFIWEDIYAGNTSTATHELTIRKEDEIVYSVSFVPVVSDGRIFAVQPDIDLEDGLYEYEISSKPSRRYFGFRKYPLNGSFTVDKNMDTEYGVINISEYSVFMYNNYYNKNTNLYDSIFFLSASTVSLGAGLLTYFFFNYNIYTTIASYLFFGASAIGYPASMYYSYKYFANKYRYKKQYEHDTLSMQIFIINTAVYTTVTVNF